MKSLDTDYETLALDEATPGVVVVTLNRPDRYNAMTNTMFDELERLALALDHEHGCRVVVLTGAGKAFCSGYDLGLSLALAADIRFASASAKFNAAFVRIGLSAGDLGASWLLTRLIGPARASEICFTGRMVAADEALTIGLVNRVSEPDRLLDDVLALAASIVANSPGGVQLSKRALQANLEISSYAAALELENRGQALLTRSADMPEALAAFKEKRPAVFTGA